MPKPLTSGSIDARVWIAGVEWEVEINWSTEEYGDDRTEIDSAAFIAYYSGDTKMPIPRIEISISDIDCRTYDTLLVFADEDRCDGYDDGDGDRAYDNWKADQL